MVLRISTSLRSASLLRLAMISSVVGPRCLRFGLNELLLWALARGLTAAMMTGVAESRVRGVAERCSLVGERSVGVANPRTAGPRCAVACPGA
jgi:hypothetical protein